MGKEKRRNRKYAVITIFLAIILTISMGFNIFLFCKSHDIKKSVLEIKTILESKKEELNKKNNTLNNLIQENDHIINIDEEIKIEKDLYKNSKENIGN